MISIRCAASLALLGVIGCGGDPYDSVALVPVKGTVTLNGKPMSNAQVSFIPVDTNAVGTPGGDTTGPEGNYMARFRNRAGLAPGKYKVTIAPGIAPASDDENIAEAFKDDPFMAGEATRAASASKPSSKKMEIRGEFDAEVTDPASILDFDVKATSAAANNLGSSSR
ncbi:carboxypeptidase-like regulatory domain-containing protein [Tundrisphaera lichenicola]|uniref:carboxypeptidase-like regulatory domain-containing protein n=1 Tax=Tundrisphaera lichenicola TaxID=2029860 RepID=UPI003EB932F3